MLTGTRNSLGMWESDVQGFMVLLIAQIMWIRGAAYEGQVMWLIGQPHLQKIQEYSQKIKPTNLQHNPSDPDSSFTHTVVVTFVP